MKTTVEPFALEEFFDQFEHRPGLVNLASSDAEPWTSEELRAFGIRIDDQLVWRYPDPKPLARALARHDRLPATRRAIATGGAAEAIALILHYLASVEGDERPIAVPRPAYGAFVGLARLLRMRVLAYDYSPSRQWTPDVERLFALAETCRAVIVNNPHNPTGHVLGREVMDELRRRSSKHGGALLVDAVFALPDDGTTIDFDDPNVFVVRSLSKTHGLPGLRLGWLTAADEHIRALRNLQWYLTLSPPATTVALGPSVLEHVEQVSRAGLIHAARDILTAWASRHRNISISTPAAGTTVCLTVHAPLDETALFDAFLREGVLLVPGTGCFGVEADEPWFRLGYAIPASKLSDGLARVARALQSVTAGRH